MRNKPIVFGFCGGWYVDIFIRSIDRIIPVIVINSAPSLMVFGMVITVVVCNVDSFVVVPTKIEPSVSRRMGLIGILVS